MRKTKSYIITGIAILLLIGIMIGTNLESTITAQSAAEDGVIRVSGNAIVTQAPDIVTIAIGVETKNESAETASLENRQIMDEVMKSLREFGLKENEITTSGYSIYSYQETDRSQDPVEYYTIYTVRNQINIKTKQLEDVGTIIDLAIKGGANQVQGINFDIEDKEEMQLRALEQATLQARAKAEAIAAAAEVSIKNITGITEQTESYVPYTESLMVRASGQDSAGTAINPGDVEVRSRVTVEFSF